MRRRLLGFALVLMSVVLLMAGCGKKDAGAVVKDLDKLADGLQSYTTTGTMTLNTGTEPQEYQVEVSFQQPSYYRIALTNQKKDISQIVLKNDDGVFVLTPHLNKSFRFQSDWPENQGQVYLYKSLVNSINQDKERQFTTDGDSYVFDVMANYSNASLSRQKIWLNKKTYAPQSVEIYDAQNNPVVVMTFNNFKFDETFEKDYFDMQRNMTGARLVLPTLGQQPGTGQATGAAQPGEQAAGVSGAGSAVGSSGTAGGASGTAAAGSAGGAVNGAAAVNGAGNGAAPASSSAGGVSSIGNAAGTTGAGAAGNGTAATGAGTAGNGTAAAVPAAQQEAAIIEPSYIPQGVGKPQISETKVGENPAVLLKYSGTYNYTLIESRPTDKSASFQKGELIDLGLGFYGVMTGEDKKTLTWMDQGVEFRLSSGDLPVAEMVNIAMAVQGQSIK
ncbi:MAG: rane protein [Paenibacillaceae bacterium]|jgi:outer membrane lipoprotein-sorting protein|nr:rane protein [Paenibacillaceae bacterium]